MSGAGVALKSEVKRPMTVQVMKTKAETGFSEDFARVEARLPGNDAVRKLRRDAIGRFAALGLPHRRNEDWKYTDLRAMLKEAAPLAVGGHSKSAQSFVGLALGSSLKGLDRSGDWMLFADGRHVTGNGLLNSVASSLGAVLGHSPAWVDAEMVRAIKGEVNGVQALNSALMTDGVVLDIPDSAEFDAPVHLVFAASGDEEADKTATVHAVTRNIIRVGKGAKVTLVESFASAAARSRHVNAMTQLVIGDGAEVTHIKLTETHAGDVHLGNWLVRIGANASYKPFQATLGEGIVRNDLHVTFEGQHSTFDLGAATLGHASGHGDTTLVVDHAVPHCTSRELFKTVLDGTSRAVFQGKVIVRPDAQKTDGKQMAKALLLSPDAEFDSKPELEIYADDVVCGHGSTSAELDEDLIFYCRSRGIPLETARAMLVESFIGEAIDKVEDEQLRYALMTKARACLTR